MKLLFVYNADDGLFNALNDTVHKFFSPETYECRLCFFTYGTFGMLLPWKNFLKSLDYPKLFYHRKDFWKVYGRQDIPLPAILVEDDGAVQELVPADEINACEGLEELMQKVSGALDAYEANR